MRNPLPWLNIHCAYMFTSIYCGTFLILNFARKISLTFQGGWGGVDEVWFHLFCHGQVKMVQSPELKKKRTHKTLQIYFK